MLSRSENGEMRIQTLLLVVLCVCLHSGWGNQGTEVDHLVEVLNHSLNDPIVDPRALLALRLSHPSSPISSTEWQAVRQLQQQAAQQADHFSSGMVGLYVLAISSCCLSPFHIPDPQNGPSIDLVAILTARLEQEMASVARYGYPITTYYQVALALLGLCETHAPVTKIYVQTFSEAVLKGLIFRVDTEAVSALAARCLLDQGYKPSDQIRTALIKLTAGIYCARTENGTIGNLYSTGLAMQALIANEDMLPRLVWRAGEVELAMLSAVRAGAFDMLISAAQLLPALLGRSFLDVDQMPCAEL